jgi:hypothetical protein
MSGCHHPVTRERTHFIRVDAIKFKGIVGSSVARLLVPYNNVFSPSDMVVVTEVSVGTDIPTGNSITRFIAYVEDRLPFLVDEDAIAIRLVPTRSMIEGNFK